MKGVFFFTGVFSIILNTCLPRQEVISASNSAIHDTTLALVDFTKDVKPVLMQRCSPCHFTGGKMYEKMPFDKSETLLSHQQGILRRIKDEKENQILRNYITRQGAIKD
ncbi:MAG TPA: hypothetical protein VFX58_08765 [Chitinophagaceae bacterium]|nr:hypothetical protein [Chitinophagaceae bacterium]